MITTRQIVVWTTLAAICMLIAIVIGFVVLKSIHNDLVEDATPPEGMVTIHEFQEWKGDKIFKREYNYTDIMTNQSYRVFFAPSGRVLASGPSAYLFSREGYFVDWTPDIGDTHTKIHKYNLALRNLERSE